MLVMSTPAALLSLFLLAGLAPAPPQGLEIARMAVHVDGLACPFCARGVEKMLAGLPEVGSVKVDLATGRVDLGLVPGPEPTVASLEQAVRRAGFTLRDVEVTYVGVLRRQEDALELDNRQGGGGMPLDLPAATSANQQLRSRLLELAGESAVVGITLRRLPGDKRPVSAAPVAVAPLRSADYQVEGIECADCPVRLRKALRGGVPQLYRATLAEGSARLHLEVLGPLPEPDVLRAALAGTPFSLRPVPAEGSR